MSWQRTVIKVGALTQYNGPANRIHLQVCLLSGPLNTFSMFFFANLTILNSPYISVFDMAIAVLKLSNILVQKTKYMHEMYFQHTDSAQFF